MVGLYYSDVLSDLFQTISFYNNCHFRYFGVSITIIVTSYIITAVFVKLTTKWTWTQAFKFPWKCKSRVVRYTKICWTALQKGRKMPEEPEEVMKLRKNVCIMVTMTESIPQLLMSCIVLRGFGISKDFFTSLFQVFTLVTSSVSPCVTFGNVSIYDYTFNVIDNNCNSSLETTIPSEVKEP